MKQEISIQTKNRYFSINPFNTVHFILSVIFASWLLSHGRQAGEFILFSIAGRYLYVLTAKHEIKDLHWGVTIIITPLIMWLVNMLLINLFG